MRKLFLIHFLILSASFTMLGQITGKDSSFYLFPPDSIMYNLDDVVVTATRGEQKIIDIPYPVVRISNKQFKFDKKTAVNDVLGNVPGLFMQSRYGNHDVRISIRGFGSRSNTGIRGVRILLDGIPESEPDGQTRIEAIDFNSVGAIEIVKGNSSSLYTNAPGGVVNFINDIDFNESFVTQFNQIGGYDLRQNGIKAGVARNNLKMLFTYTYHNYTGYRAHSQDYWNILNTVIETKPDNLSKLQILGYFVDGLIKLPGSLTKAEYDADPYQAAQRETDFDFRRVSKKGRIGLRYSTAFDETFNNHIEITTYGTIKYFERTQRDYRIINRYGLGVQTRWLNKSVIAGLKNEFSLGGDAFYQTGPVESYTNIGGIKSDILNELTDETIINSGFFVQNNLELIKSKLNLLVTGRFDRVVFEAKNQILGSQNDRRVFQDFTPKFAVNYKFTPRLSVYVSYGFSFDSPAGNELDNYPTSSNTGKLYNPDLKSQESQNFEIGTKGNFVFPERDFLKWILYEITFYNYRIENEIVPFEVFTNVYYRNSAKTTRSGIESGVDIGVVNGVSFSLSYTYSGFKYSDYQAYVIENIQGQIVTNIREYSGKVVPSVPEHNFITSITLENRFSTLISGYFKGTFNFISGMYGDDANTAKSDGYSLLNFTIGCDISPSSRFNILLNAGINNITDVKYVSFLNINSTSGRFYEAGEPRNFFAGITFGFRF